MRATYANVMATLGVFIALGGTSWAAVKIDGSQVRDGSLTGRDVRDRGLTGADLKSRSIGKRHLRKGLLARRGARGPVGATGPRGLTGPPGPAGQRGPSHGFLVQDDEVVGKTLKTVSVLNLEPGNWMFSATGLMENQDDLRNIGDCSLFSALKHDGGLTFSAQLGTTGFIPLEAADPLNSSISAESFAITAAAKFDEPTQVHLMCRSGSGPLRVRHLALTALQVDELTFKQEAPGT